MQQVKTVLFLILLLALPYVQAQDILPFTENFTKSNYYGDNQVWGLTQGGDNAMYFANNHYFLRYNGVKWEKYTLPNKTIIRSVMADGNRIYCGSYKEFGYWVRELGKMRYYSISSGSKLFTGNSENEEVWKIFKVGRTIYFQSFNELYAWKDNKLAKLRFPSQVSYCYVVNNTVYAASVTNGVYRLAGSEFSPVVQWPQLKNTVVHGMESQDGNIYVFTKNNGIFKGSASALVPWQHEVNQLLISNIILSAKFISPGKLAVGTALNGIYIIDTYHNAHININRGNALRNNAVLALGLDKENDLWLGLDNGISHIEVNSPVSLFTDNSGSLGSVYALAAMPDGYLLGTNHGLFGYSNSRLTGISGLQGQVWDISRSGTEYIIGHNDGTFGYSAGKYTKYSNINGGWNFLYSRLDNVYFQANYSGIAVYFDPKDLSKHKILNNFTKPIRSIAQSRPGELWAADNYRGLYRLEYDYAFHVTKVENISQKNGISDDFGVRIFTFHNEILFFISGRWYQYNAIAGRLENNILFNKNFPGVEDVIPVGETSFIVMKQGLLYYVMHEAGSFSWTLIPAKYYEGRLLSDYTRCFRSGTQLFLNLDDGFMAFSPVGHKRGAKVNIEVFNQGRMLADGARVKHNSPVELNIIPEFFGYKCPELFYKITGRGSIARVGDGSFTLNNLGSGNNDITVYVSNGQKLSVVAAYSFYVASPWYYSWWMIIVYITVVGGILFLYYKWNKIRYLERVRLNEEELKHRTQILELEMEAENKLRQQEYEKHLLEIEVQAKASEVAGKSLSIAKHSEMIENIQEVLETESSADQIRNKIRKIIKVSSLSKNEWEHFERNLMKSHEEFVARLTSQHPLLTPKDIKLSIYLRMNLSSKEIAPLMNISFRGVELHRYRLRKKLALPQEANLAKYMLSV